MISAFIGHTFDPEDSGLVQAIIARLESAGIRAVTTSPKVHVSTNPPSEMVRLEILKCECLIAILTKDSAWIQNEIGMAFMAHKPIFALSEKGKSKIGGISTLITSIHEFDRNNLELLTPILTNLIMEIDEKLCYGNKMDWYGDAVHEINLRLSKAKQIDIIGRSTRTFFDALNTAIKKRIKELNSLELNIFCAQSDESTDDIRPSAKLILPSWRKRYPKVNFFVMSNQVTQLRAIIFDRDTNDEECYTGKYTQDDEGIYLGVTQRMERWDKKSVAMELIKEVLSKAKPYKDLGK